MQAQSTLKIISFNERREHPISGLIPNMQSNNSVYKFIDIEDLYNIKNLKNNELFCKSFNCYNDPYEGHFGLRPNGRQLPRKWID